MTSERAADIAAYALSPELERRIRTRLAEFDCPHYETPAELDARLAAKGAPDAE